MKTIYKYQLKISSDTQIKLPTGSMIRHVGTDPHGMAAVWIEVETDNPTETITFKIVGTGYEIPHEGWFVGTFVQGNFVWHVYAS